MESIVLIVHILLAVGIIAFVMMQQGKGADAGASFGSGASQTVFGSSGSGNFLSRTTAILATLFFVTSLVLGIYARQKVESSQDLGIPSQEVIEKLEQDAPVVEEYAPSSDAPDLDASDADEPAVEETEK
ncbi:MAG: preprotein translocase subunit SecG [Oceanospirillaceae bacterium]|uniref:preprotein translocase subunit SecG n=1 Tax=unclassified Thalassolituus TaxID=2624967 RepID=UPI000C0A3440|nr:MULTISPECIES: preprotein translocase subunit SecG [unclassified Thalassolituus]MAK90491.1 preprotein translocase subunit SecG [Thalassolituus sp.]MAS25654.1 preprotein translocase subunit SecG [Oceanospirillaceae bacterium]MAX98805.1 preprotein translocase subunit SecG [Oceanospirillaceae bacterium]MBS52242.1 preprotein translocase subunit SecG [Oceanospirillaceae bacterium]|tara:strand:+ start:1206 stop:1595 length:390 start_codon:yes stop_codon:yes gene_type:complete